MQQVLLVGCHWAPTNWRNWLPMSGLQLPPVLLTERSRFLFKLGELRHSTTGRISSLTCSSSRLTANYAPYPDGNVPRQGLYFSYRRVCDQYGIPHINTATLGKAIRLCFPTIKTRRLGVRGNSKYHCKSPYSHCRKYPDIVIRRLWHSSRHFGRS